MLDHHDHITGESYIPFSFLRLVIKIIFGISDFWHWESISEVSILFPRPYNFNLLILINSVKRTFLNTHIFILGDGSLKLFSHFTKLMLRKENFVNDWWLREVEKTLTESRLHNLDVPGMNNLVKP